MRYLLDTNTVIYFATDHSKLDRDVISILQDENNLLYMSVESVREIIVAYKNKGFVTKKWKTCNEFLDMIASTLDVAVLPLDNNVMRTYANLHINTAQGHKDPSDHVIISHAISLHMPLISCDTRFPFYRRQGLDLIFNTK